MRRLEGMKQLPLYLNADDDDVAVVRHLSVELLAGWSLQTNLRRLWPLLRQRLMTAYIYRHNTNTTGCRMKKWNICAFRCFMYRSRCQTVPWMISGVARIWTQERHLGVRRDVASSLWKGSEEGTVPPTRKFWIFFGGWKRSVLVHASPVSTYSYTSVNN